MKLAVFLIFLVSLNLSLGQEHLDDFNKVLQINQKRHYDIKSRDPDMFMNMEFVVPKNLQPGHRLAIITRPDDYRSDPDIFIHHSISQPTVTDLLKTHVDHFCYHYGPDFCLIPEEYLIPGKTLYITVYIQFGPCLFNLEVRQINPPSQLEFNVEQRLFLKDDDNDFEETLAEYFSVRLPTEEENPDVYSMSISVIRQNPSYVYEMNSELNEHDLHMMFSMGKKDPNTNNQYLREGLYNLENGILFQIDNKHPLWKRGETYNFVVTSNDRDHISVFPRLIKKEEIIPLTFDTTFHLTKKNLPVFLKAEDVVTYKIQDFYKLHDKDIADKQKLSTIIELHQTFGDADLYVDCKENVNNFQQSKFATKSFEIGSEILLISSEEIDENCKDLYITAFAEQYNSIFNIQISFKPEDLDGDNILPIKPGVKEYGYLKTDEMASYILELKRDAVFNVTVSLQALKGNTDLYIRKCGKDDQCLIEKNLINEKDSIHDKQLVQFSQTDGNDVISFRHNSDSCFSYNDHRQNSPYCFYIIMVYNKQYIANHTIKKDLKYSLSVSLGREPQYLRENDVTYGVAHLNEFNYYMFHIDSYNDIESIVFIITPLSGDPNLMVSRKATKPNYQNSEFISVAWYNYVEYLESDLLNLPDEKTFYIGVHGFTECTFTIRTVIHRKSDKLKIRPTQLVNAVAMNSLLKENQKYVYFDFPIHDSHNLIQIQSSVYDSKHNLIQIFGRPLYESDVEKVEQIREEDYPYRAKGQYMQIENDIQTTKEGFIGYRFMVRRQSEKVNEKLYFSIFAQSLDSFIKMVPGQQREFIVYTQNGDKGDLAEQFQRGTFFEIEVDLQEDQEIHIGIDTEVHKNFFYLQMFTVKENALKMVQGAKYSSEITIDQDKDRYFAAFLNFKRSMLETFCEGQMYSKCKLYGFIGIIERNTFADAEMYDNRVNLLMLKVDKKNQASKISLKKNENLKIPVITRIDKPINYVMYYEIPNNETPFFIDIQGQNIASQVKTQIVQLSELNGKEQFASSIDLGETDVSKFKHYYRDFDSKELSKYKCSATMKCYLLVNIQSLANNKYLNVQIGEDIHDISKQMSEFITGNVKRDSYKYYKVYIPKEVKLVNFMTNMINGGDTDMIVYHSPTEDKFRPQHTSSSSHNCNESPGENHECKISTVRGKGDKIVFKPGKQGYYIIGIYGVDVGDNLFSLHWSAQGGEVEINEIQEGVVTHLEAKFSEFSKHFFTPSETKSDKLNLLFSSSQTLFQKLKLRVVACQDHKFQLKSEGRFCNREEGEEKKVKHIDLHETSINIDLEEMCPNRHQQGVNCHIMIAFRSTTNDNINFDLLVTQSDQNQQVQSTLKPGNYFKNTILKGETHKFSLLFADPKSQKDHFLNVNSIIGNLDIKVIPESIRIRPLMGYSKNIFTVQIYGDHFNQLSEGKDPNNYSLKSIDLLISGCLNDFGCEYGLGVSVAGQSLKLTPGLLYTGILNSEREQIFDTHVDTQSNKNKKSYLSITTFVPWNKNPKNLYVSIQVLYQTNKRALAKTQNDKFEVKKGFHSFVVHVEENDPKISVKIIDENEKKMTLFDVEFSLLMQSGVAQELLLENNVNKHRVPSITQPKFQREQPDIFIIKSLKKGSVYVQVKQCSQQFKLNFGTDYDSLLQIDNDSINSGNQDEVVFDIEDKIPYYVSVQMQPYTQEIPDTNGDKKDPIPLYLGFYNIQAYYFKQQTISKDLLPNYQLSAGGDGTIKVFQQDKQIYFGFYDIKAKSENIKRISGSSDEKMWARVLITSGEKRSHKNLQMCKHLPAQESFSRRRFMEGNDISEQNLKDMIKDQNKSDKLEYVDANSEPQIYQDQFLLNDLENNYTKKNEQYKHSLVEGDFVFSIDRKELKEKFPSQEKLYVSVTIVLPPNSYTNLPIDNYYDLEINYEPTIFSMSQINKVDKQFKKAKNSKTWFIISMILSIPLLGLLIFFIIRRVQLKLRQNKNMGKDGRIQMPTDSHHADDQSNNIEQLEHL